MRSSTPLFAAIPAALLLLPRTADAVGYQILRVDGLFGTTETGSSEGGIGIALLSDELDWWMTFGDDAFDRGHTVKEWNLESEIRGPVMGHVPSALVARGKSDGSEEGAANTLLPWSFWKLGSDFTTNRNFQWDWSRHYVLNVPGFFGGNARLLQFGPTAGLGLNLTWWKPYKDIQEHTITTGKVTGEVGGVAGFSWKDAIYAQGRVTWAYDLFGIHQTDLHAEGLAGLFFGERGIPLGVEIRADFDQGNDTFDALPATAWTLMGVVTWRLLPARQDREIEEALQNMRFLLDMEEGLPGAGSKHRSKHGEGGDEPGSGSGWTTTPEKPTSSPEESGAQESGTEPTPATQTEARPAPPSEPASNRQPTPGAPTGATAQPQPADEGSASPPEDDGSKGGPKGPEL
jgi:hypothetical protein